MQEAIVSVPPRADQSGQRTCYGIEFGSCCPTKAGNARWRHSVESWFSG
jgi:hypothetical protein